MIRYVLLLIASLMLYSTSYAVDDRSFSARVSFSENSLPADHYLTVELSLEYPPEYHVDRESLRSGLLRNDSLSESPFRLADEKSIKTPSEKGVREKITYILDPQAVGTFPLSFYAIRFIAGDQKYDVISSIFLVEVTSPSGDPYFEGIIAPLLTLSPRLPVEIDSKNRMTLLQNAAVEQAETMRNRDLKREGIFPWRPLGAALAFVIFVFSFVLMQRKERVAAAAEVKSLPEVREGALQSLAKVDLMSPDGVFYATLSESVRHYIEEAYQIRASHMTTEEFLQSMTVHQAFDSTTRESLKTFLEGVDRVKFSRHAPSAVERKSAYDAAERFILAGLLHHSPQRLRAHRGG